MFGFNTSWNVVCTNDTITITTWDNTLSVGSTVTDGTLIDPDVSAVTALSDEVIDGAQIIMFIP